MRTNHQIARIPVMIWGQARGQAQGQDTKMSKEIEPPGTPLPSPGASAPPAVAAPMAAPALPAPPPLAADISEVPVAYKAPADALEAVRADFLYWSGKLTDTSFELSLGLIAANWAVFGSVARVLGNDWAKASIFFVVLSLGVNLAGSKWMSEMLRHRYEYAEGDPVGWTKEFRENRGRRVPWPFTDQMESLGRFLRECKTWLPIIGGILFLIGLILA